MQTHTVTPYLVVRDVSTLIDFLTAAFGAKETLRHSRPDGTIQHAEVQIGPSKIMMGEPQPGGSSMPAMLYLDVDSVDRAYAQAIAVGGKSLREPADQPQGGRMAGVQDPGGNQWYMASAIVP